MFFPESSIPESFAAKDVVVNNSHFLHRVVLQMLNITVTKHLLCWCN